MLVAVVFVTAMLAVLMVPVEMVLVVSTLLVASSILSSAVRFRREVEASKSQSDGFGEREDSRRCRSHLQGGAKEKETAAMRGRVSLMGRRMPATVRSRFAAAVAAAAGA